MIRALLFASALAGALPALAQTAPTPTASPAPAASSPAPAAGERVSLDSWRPENCPKPSKPGEIIVCGRPPAEPPVRVPPAQPQQGDRLTDVPAEREALLEHGKTGIGSCSPVGPGGETGCTVKQWEQARKTRKREEEVPER